MKLLNFIGATVFGSATLIGYGIYDGNEKVYSNLLIPIIHKTMDGERAHNLAIFMAKYGLVPRERKFENEQILNIRVFDKKFKNPIGCAAGFDKNAEAIDGLFKIGFGFVEIGTVTPLSQEGNPKPRVFRLSEDRAVINRYGFNGQGHDEVLKRVDQFWKNRKIDEKILGVNIGKNKLQQDALSDYLTGLKLFANKCDYITINISSPNTPGLRSLQNRKELENLIDPVEFYHLLLEMRNKLDKKIPLVIKIAPDLTDEEMKDIAQVALRKNKQIDGLIVSNTTISRPDFLKSELKKESGGLSGRPLKTISTEALKKMFKLTEGKIILIGVGGVESGNDALEKIKSGASLIQLYTSMVFEGPIIVNKIKKELIELLNKEGYSNVSEAIGANVYHKNSK
ncbi:dihydroorotate dehydrogenase (quinone) mitochondrial-like [Brachionus plicatilis]|uniref:Dihydroorotate dehydrogenase (quinone), mitochondrial n=1 Tax=Brachionus plicatilis TaxID=10195 RepID=A0A3M7R9X8_BRAPC|nr:dihydroorotate dehydrogenase (quinone) mitochondrial-like [Brachionus plicatilis]